MRYSLLPSAHKFFFLFSTVYLVLAAECSLLAQRTDTFEDGNFTANPAWIGQVDSFIVFNADANNWLRLNASGTNTTSYLATASTGAYGTWEVRFRMDFALSTSNFSRFYFISSSSVLTGSLNGYFLAFSQVSQEIGLYRQTGTTTTRLAGATVSALGSAPVNIRARVARNSSGQFEVFTDATGGTDFSPLFTFTDNTHQTSAFLGVTARYTSTRNKQFYWDDFIWPDVPFRLNSANAASRTEIELTFTRPPNPATAIPSAFSITGAGNPASVQISGNTALLVYSTALTSGPKTVTVAASLTDTENTPIQNDFRTAQFNILDVPAAGELIINEFLYDPPTGMQDYVELVNTTTDRFFSLRNYRITDNATSATISADVLVEPGAYVVVSSDTSILRTTFGAHRYVLLPGFPNLNATGADAVVLRSETGSVIDSLTYNSSWGTAKKALERRSFTAPTTARANWGASPAAIGTPGVINQIAPDITAPVLRSALLRSDTELLLTFSEEITLTSAQNTANYTFTQGVTATSAVRFQPDSVLVTVIGIQSDTPFILTVSGIRDLFGNTMSATQRTLEWLQISTPVPGDLVINEFMYDPPTGLQDYVELLNRSTKNIDLAQIRFADAVQTFRNISTSQRVLKPGQFMVVLRDSVLLNVFPGAPLAVMGSGFPSLNNTGQESVIIKAGEVTIDSVTWNSSTWGGSKVSLERRSATAPATSRNNWLPSTDSRRGTAGFTNTAQPDTTRPRITGISILDAQTIELTVDEDLLLSSASQASATITGGLTVNIVSIPDARIIRVQLLQAMTNRTEYTLTVSGATDVFNNPMRVEPRTFTYFTLGNPLPGAIRITEFMYDPPTGFTEFIEIRNVTETAFNLQNWTYNDRGGARRAITTLPFMLPPDGFVVLAPDSTVARLFPGIKILTMGSGFHSLNNSDDNIVIRSSAGVLLDSLTYFSSWGGAAVSLERRSLTVSSVLQDNWGSSIAAEKATPGRTNSIGALTGAPTLLTAFASRPDTLTFDFNRAVQFSDNFSVQITPNRAVSGFSINNRRLILRLGVPLNDQETIVVRLSGLEDIFKNPAGTIQRSLSFFEFKTPAPGDIRITEFLYDPPTGTGEFVEIRNVTNRVLNLQNWVLNNSRLSRPVITTPRALMPGAYFVFAADSSILRNFGTVDGVVVPSFPALNNTTDAVVIRSAERVTLDSLTYTVSWGGSRASLERRSLTLAATEQDNWGTSLATTRMTPGTDNTVAPLSTPPALVAVSLQTPDSIFVDFDRNISAGTAFMVQLTGTSAPTVLATNFTARRMRIRLSRFLNDRETVGLVFENVRDIFGNTLSRTEREITYYDFKPANLASLRITEFAYDPPPGIAEFVELENISNDVLDLNTLRISNRATTIRTISATRRPFLPGQRIVLTGDSALFRAFPSANVLVVTGFPTLTNTSDAVVIKNLQGLTLDSLTYTSGWGGREFSLERRSNTVRATVAANWGNSPATARHTLGLPNLITPDVTRPTAFTADLIAGDSVRVRFSEDIQPNIGSPQVLAEGVPATAMRFSGLDIFAGFSSLNISGSTLNIGIRGFQDWFGNMMRDTTLSIVIPVFEPAAPGDLVINEFLYRSNTTYPEFVEVWNVSRKRINLSGWRIANESGSAQIRPLIAKTSNGLNIPLLPDSMIVLTGNATLAATLRNAWLVTGMPTLGNAGDNIVLRNPAGLAIDSLYYRDSWGASTAGQALERRDPFRFSNDPANWATVSNGGTPGRVNRNFEPDVTPPAILIVKPLGADTLEVRFSEFVTVPADAFSVNGVASATLQPNSTPAKVWRVRAPTLLQPGTVTSVSVTRATDARDNAAVNLTAPVAWRPRAGELAINEILADPIAITNDNRPDQSEYVELVNTSRAAVSIEGVRLQTPRDELGRFRILAVDDTRWRYLNPGERMVVHADTAKTFLNSRISVYFGINDGTYFFRSQRTTLGMGATSGTVIVADSTGFVIDSVAYSSRWHNPNRRDTRGRSLERIDPKTNPNQGFNWSTSTAEIGGTPGAPNTLFRDVQVIENENTVTVSPNPFSPDADGFEDQTVIAWRFDRSDYMLRIRVFDRYGRQIRTIADHFPAGTQGSVLWDGDGDDRKTARPGLYIVVIEAYDSAGGRRKTFKQTVALAAGRG